MTLPPDPQPPLDQAAAEAPSAPPPRPDGWYAETRSNARQHWLVGGQPLCAPPVPLTFAAVRTNDQPGAVLWACDRCRSEITRQHHRIPFRVGQQVVSRVEGMTLKGRIVGFFEAADGTPLLNITRTNGQEEDGPDTNWYRAPSECQLLTAPERATSRAPRPQEDVMTASTAKKPKSSKKKAEAVQLVATPAFQLGDDVRVRMGRPDPAVITNLKDEKAQLLYADDSRVWMPLTALEKKATWAQPETEQASTTDLPDPDLPFPVEADALEQALEQATPASPGAVPLGALGLHAVPLHQTTRSSCNVRRHYDPDAIDELAASLEAEGQIENATGRWNAEGLIEIVAGESRRRAQLLRQEGGEAGLTLLVNVRQLTDAEALSISATENMRRRSMTPLEECEAMLRLHEAGRSAEEIQALFGYKTVQPVMDRLLAARNLHEDARDALDTGKLHFAQAFVIARAPGAELQASMLRSAVDRRSTAKELSATLTQGQFLVKDARFNVEKSGLEVTRDLFDAFEPYFKHKAKALDAQIAWAQQRAEKKRKEGKFPFVAVESGAGTAWGNLESKKYQHTYSNENTGLIYYVNTNTGVVSEETHYRMKAEAAKKAVGAGEATSTPATRHISESAYLEAHERRASALRDSVVGNIHLTLALTVWGLILQSTTGTVRIGEIQGLKSEVARMPQLGAEVMALRERLQPARQAKGSYDGHHPLLTGPSFDRAALLELLRGMDQAELLGILNTLTCLTAYDWTAHNPKTPPAAEYVALAALTDAPQRLAEGFTLTDEWLKRYPRHELVALAEEAGLGRALVEDCATQKEMRARILEHAARLHAEGFVPRLLRFPTPEQA